MLRHEFLEQLQNNIVDKLGTSGTAEVATGVGKTFIAFKWLYKYVPKGSKVSFFAETIMREETMKDEAFKFKWIYKKDPLLDYYISFHCYQGVPETDSVAHIYDEVHDMLTPVFADCYFQNKPEYRIGLSAYVPDTFVDKTDPYSLTKRQLLAQIAPIKVIYSLEQGVRDGVLSPYEMKVIEYELDNTSKHMIGGTKNKPTAMTERQYHDYFENRRRADWAQTTYRMYCGRNIKTLLQSNRSVIPKVKELLPTTGRTIVFGVDLNVLEAIVPGAVVCSKRSKLDNARIVERFNKGEINVVGSYLMLKQGITLEGVETCIMVSYHSTKKDFIQRVGRVVRWAEDKKAKVFIYLVKDSPMHMKWLTSMTEKDLEETEVNSNDDV